jgi:hypothetical protein
MSNLLRLSLSVCLFSLALPGQGKLGEAGKTAAATLARAGWSGSVESPDVSFTVRLAPVCTPAMRNAMTHLSSLSEKQQMAFAEWAKIEFRRPGWFFKTKVDKGSYHIGLGFAHGQPIFLLRKDSKTVGQNPFWFEGEVRDPAAGELQQNHGATRLTIRFGNIRLNYRFVPEAVHEALIGRLKVYGLGRVKVRSDVGCPSQLKELAAWLDQAMAGSEAFLGAEVGKQRYELYLFATQKGYQAVDQLVTGGAFARNWAFTSNQNQISYLWYHPHAEPEAFVGHGIPMRLQVLCLHELQHALSYKVRPALIDSIPRWFAEALAERGAHAGLVEVDASAAKEMHQRHLDRLAYARADMGAPAFQDLLDWKAGSKLSEIYSAAYLFSRRGPAMDGKGLPDLLSSIGNAGFPQESLFVLRDAGWNSSAFAKTQKVGSPKLPLRIYGDYDLTDKRIRLISSKESEGRILLPKLVGKDGVQLSGSFSWQGLGSRQADIYLAYRRGFQSAEFLKLAFMPRRVVLFWFRAGTWFRVSIQDFDQDLEVGSGKKLAWHRFAMQLDAKTKKLELTIGKDRKAVFTLPGSLDLAGSRVGLGVYDGIAWFKDIQIR